MATPPSHGTVSITGESGAFTYTPAKNYVGADQFGFTVTDTKTGLTSNVAVVSLQVRISPNSTIQLGEGGGGAWSLCGLLLLAAIAGFAALIRRRQAV